MFWKVFRRRTKSHTYLKFKMSRFVSDCNPCNWLWDDHTGEYVCTECAKCVDCVPSSSSSSSSSSLSKLPSLAPSAPPPPSQQSSNRKPAFSHLLHAPIMHELCSKLHIDGDVKINNCVDGFAKLYNRLRHRTDFLNVDIATVSLYKCLGDDDESRRPIRELCQISGSNLKRVWKLQKHLEQCLHQSVSINPLTPEDVIKSKIGYGGGDECLLTFKDFAVLSNVLKKTRHLHGDYSIYTIAAYVTYDYLRKKSEHKITKNSVAKVFGSTTTSMTRYQSYLKKNNVTLTYNEGRLCGSESP